ncbi:hypothetical protein Mgra_00008196 [Meloidogyne graminicola]|uniref:Uncharacterized protein n=1 Tax=Meloidogyne graminicola TaxID=189291 RepID=A0A8S9ZGG7_9BILA|nr:hypothetical protein Mgra_00008196 [Meloidogyne graminicola]
MNKFVKIIMIIVKGEILGKNNLINNEVNDEWNLVINKKNKSNENGEAKKNWRKLSNVVQVVKNVKDSKKKNKQINSKLNHLNSFEKLNELGKLTKKQIEKRLEKLKEIYESYPFWYKWWINIKGDKKVFSAFVIFFLGIMELTADLIEKNKYDPDWNDEIIASQIILPQPSIYRKKRNSEILNKKIKNMDNYFKCKIAKTEKKLRKEIIEEGKCD